MLKKIDIGGTSVLETSGQQQHIALQLLESAKYQMERTSADYNLQFKEHLATFSI